MADIQERVKLLKKIHLFHGLSENRLTELVEAMGDAIFVEEGKEVYPVGDKADFIYIVVSGKIKLTRKNSKSQPDLYEAGDYFGLEATSDRARRDAKAETIEKATLLKLHRVEVNKLFKESEHFKNTIQIAKTSRKITTQMNFKWLKPDETIYLIARKHPIVMYQMLMGPVFGLLVPFFFLFLVTLAPGSIIPWILTGLAFLGEVLWFIWAIVDYGNDYYIITNRRVIWLEKVVALYDSRQESPLSMTLPITVETGVVGRMLDFGEVIIRTYTSRIIFSDIERPHQVKAMLDEYIERTKEMGKRQEVEAMKEAIRVKLGLAQPKIKPAPPVPEKQIGRKISIPRILIGQLFQLRTEEGGKITYRKHWYILLQEIFWPTLTILFTLVSIAYLIAFSENSSRYTIVVVLVFALLGFTGWWVFRFVDWRNDRFEITPEQILDIDKRPLGLEERKSAKLEDILSIQYRREGLASILLNFGTVYIMVGTTEFTFDEVHNPALVQSEVEEWRNRRLIQKRNQENADERERMSNWIAAYHNNRDDLLSPEN